MNKQKYISEFKKIDNEIKSLEEKRKILTKKCVKECCDLQIGQGFSKKGDMGSFVKKIEVVDDNYDEIYKFYIWYGIMLESGTKLDNSYAGVKIKII